MDESISTWQDDPAVGQYSQLIDMMAQRYGIDPATLAAHVKVESGGNAEASDPARDAVGLMMLTPSVARILGVKDRSDPAQSIEAGALLLSAMRRNANGDPDVATAMVSGGTDTGNHDAKTAAYVDSVTKQLQEWMRSSPGSAGGSAAPQAQDPTRRLTDVMNHPVGGMRGSVNEKERAQIADIMNRPIGGPREQFEADDRAEQVALELAFDDQTRFLRGAMNRRR